MHPSYRSQYAIFPMANVTLTLLVAAFPYGHTTYRRLHDGRDGHTAPNHFDNSASPPIDVDRPATRSSSLRCLCRARFEYGSMEPAPLLRPVRHRATSSIP